MQPSLNRGNVIRLRWALGTATAAATICVLAPAIATAAIIPGQGIAALRLGDSTARVSALLGENRSARAQPCASVAQTPAKTLPPPSDYDAPQHEAEAGPGMSGQQASRWRVLSSSGQPSSGRSQWRHLGGA